MNQQPQSKDFNVAIVGGGMCGLVLAIALNRAGIEVDLFESASKFGEAGAGVGLGPNAIRVLEKLGVMDAVRIHSGQTPAEYLCSFYPGHEEPKEHGYDPIHIYETTSEDLGLPIHRATFLGALVHLLPAHCVHFRKRCTQATYLQTSDEYLIKFSDGTTHTADVVVGADGIRSTLRKVMLRYNSGYSTGNMDEDCSALKDEHLSFSGDIAYRSLIPTQELRDAGVKLDMGRTLAICGNNQHFITFPVLSGEKLNIVAFTHDKAAATPSNRAPLPQPWTESDVSVSNLLGEFTSWNKDITTIVQHLKSPSKWYIHALNPPLETYIARNAPAGGRMVLVGDAVSVLSGVG
jgi:salicylate hydroxylase